MRDWADVFVKHGKQVNFNFSEHVKQLLDIPSPVTPFYLNYIKYLCL